MAPHREVRSSAAHRTMNYTEFSALLEQGDLVLVDVLPEASYAAGHIPGALSLPLARLAELAPRLLPEKDRPIVVYCGGPD